MRVGKAKSSSPQRSLITLSQQLDSKSDFQPIQKRKSPSKRVISPKRQIEKPLVKVETDVLESYIIDNMSVPVSDFELGMLNKIVQPNTFDTFDDFDWSHESSIIFYQNFDDLQQVLYLVGQDIGVDFLRRTMYLLTLTIPVSKLDKDQLLNILFARIMVEYGKFLSQQ